MTAGSGCAPATDDPLDKVIEEHEIGRLDIDEEE
jgi:hypothetical protein